MRKRIIIAVTFIFLALAFDARAQDEIYDYQRAYQDYVFVFDEYQKAHSNYKLTRSQYLQAKTLVSETQAREKTALMLQSRDAVIVQYLTTIRLRLSEAPGVPSTVKSGLDSRLAAEISWFENHKSQLSSAGTLNDLVADSNEASEHYAETEKLVYESLLAVSSGKVTILRNDMSNILSNTRQKVSSIASKGDHDVSSAGRWLEEIDLKVVRSLDKSIQAESDIQELYGKTNLKADKRLEIYNSANSVLSESQSLLRDAINYMKEVINSIITV